MSNELDKHIGDQLYGYESEVDAEAIWAAVRPPRRRRPWLWLLLLLGVIAGAGAAWWLKSDRAVDSERLAQVAEVPAAVPDELVDRRRESQTVVIPSDEAAAEEIAAPVSVAPAAELEAQQVQKDNTAEAIISSTPLNGELLGEHVSSSETTPLVAPEMNTITTEQLAETLVVTSPQNQKVNVLTTEEVTEINAGAAAETVSKALSTKEIGRRSLGEITYRLPTVAGAVENEQPLDIEPNLATGKYGCWRGASPWSIQVDGAYLSPRRTLGQADTLTPLITGRMATETVLEAWSTDLTLNYNWHPKWQVRAGLGYTQINTEFSFNNTEVRIDTVTGLQTIIFNPDNSVDSIFGPVLETETIERERQIYNSFRQWEVPILVNYEASLGQLSLIAEAGVRLRLTRSWEGQVLVNDNLEVEAWEDQDWYRTGVGLSLQAGLHVGYELNPQWQVRAGASVRYSPSDFSLNAAPFTERYQLGGVQLGLRYQFR